MKKLIPLLLIALLLLPSCRVGTGGEQFSPVQTDTDTDVLPVLQEETLTGETGTAIFSPVTDAETSWVTAPLKQTVPRPSTAKATQATAALTSAVTTAAATAAAKTTAKPTASAPTSASKPASAGTAPANELRGIWLSCYEFPSAQGKTKADFTAAADLIFKNISSMGLNAAFVHVRAFSDSFYPSDIFPWSQYVSGEQGKSPGYDTLAIMISAAKKYGVAFHAWINPFRVSTDSDYKKLAATNPARKIIESGNSNGDVCVLSNGIYYCPASTAAHELILSGVREVLSKYKVDGIHIDDYFYPSTSESVDKTQYQKYVADGGALSLTQWRMSNVNAFVSALYSTVKSCGGAAVSVSPSGIIADNKTKHFADAATWLSRSGYADMVIPQVYFGFNHPSVPFTSTLNNWASLKTNSNVRLACGLAAYKCGVKDSNAGSASGEWVNNNDILARQLRQIRQNGKYSGFVLFSYSYIFVSPSQAMKNEISNFKEAL